MSVVFINKKLWCLFGIKYFTFKTFYMDKFLVRYCDCIIFHKIFYKILRDEKYF